MPKTKPLIDTPELRSERRKKTAKMVIRCALAEMDMKQKDLAKKVGMTESELSGYINGHRKWDHDDLAEIARILHFSEEEWAKIGGIK